MTTPTERPLFGPKHVMIVGCGDVGAAVAETLVRQHNRTVVLDLSSEALDRAREWADEGRGARLSLADGASIRDLAAAGAQDMDVFMALTSDDATNLLAAQIAKREFNVAVVVCRVSDFELADVYGGMGLTMIGATTLLAESAVSSAGL